MACRQLARSNQVSANNAEVCWKELQHTNSWTRRFVNGPALLQQWDGTLSDQRAGLNARFALPYI